MRKKTVPVRHAVRCLTDVLMLAIFVFAAAGCASGSDAADAAESADASADTSVTDPDNADASADTAADTGTADIGAAADASDTAYSYPVSEEEALEIALEDAALTEDDVTITISELQVEEDYTCWSIEFYADDMKYDYEIDANSGDLLSRTVRDTAEQGG